MLSAGGDILGLSINELQEFMNPDTMATPRQDNSDIDQHIQLMDEIVANPERLIDESEQIMRIFSSLLDESSQLLGQMSSICPPSSGSLNQILK